MGKFNKLSKEKAKSYQQKVRSIKKLQEKSFIPSSKEEIKKLKEEFNLQNYFNILDKIWVEEGYKFSFEYYKEHLGSEPILVTYPEGNPPDNESLKLNSDKYLEHIQLDGTPESYLQYIILKIIGGQFALGWHANYNDTEIIFTSKNVSEIINNVAKKYNSFEPEAKEKALTIDPLPEFKIEKNHVSLKITLFSKWGGFIKKTYHIESTPPNKIEEIGKRTLVEYHCGINY